MLLKTLSSIAPVWANRIKNNTVADHIGEFKDFAKCIVGEAWRYTDEYLNICDECHRYAIKLEVGYCTSAFNKHVKSFEQHFNKEHSVG